MLRFPRASFRVLKASTRHDLVTVTLRVCRLRLSLLMFCSGSVLLKEMDHKEWKRFHFFWKRWGRGTHRRGWQRSCNKLKGWRRVLLWAVWSVCLLILLQLHWGVFDYSCSNSCIVLEHLLRALPGDLPTSQHLASPSTTTVPLTSTTCGPVYCPSCPAGTLTFFFPSSL